MSLKHALLGFLNYGPHTGYELKKVFDTSVAHFWSAELSQIYPTLKALEAEGLVEMKVEVQADRPNRKVYSITDDGRRELMDWLGTPAEPDQIREPLLIKLFFAAAGGKEQVLGVLRQRAEDLRERLDMYLRALEFIDSYSQAARLEHEALFWRLAVDYGMSHTQANLDWIQRTIEVVEQLDESAFVHDPEEYARMDTRRRVETLEALKKKLAAPQEAHKLLAGVTRD